MFDNLFPNWGSSGEKPPTGKSFGSEQYLAKHVNYLWNAVYEQTETIKEAVESHEARHRSGGQDELDAGQLGASTGTVGQHLEVTDSGASWKDLNVSDQTSDYQWDLLAEDAGSSGFTTLTYNGMDSSEYMKYRLMYRGGVLNSADFKIRFNGDANGDYDMFVFDSDTASYEKYSGLNQYDLTRNSSQWHVHQEVDINANSNRHMISVNNMIPWTGQYCTMGAKQNATTGSDEPTSLEFWATEDTDITVRLYGMKRFSD